MKSISETIRKYLDDKRKRKNVAEDVEEDVLMCDQMHFDAKEAYKLLRTNLLFTLPDRTKSCVIGVTSPIRGEGKSTVSINLAYTFATTNSRVLLIDMDMRLPSLAKKLKIDSKLGLSDFIIGKTREGSIYHRMKNYPNWDVIFSGSIPPTPSELIGSQRMKKFIDNAREIYDYIIIDLPPVNIVSDALTAKELVDGYVVTVREGYSDKHSLADCMRQLGFLEANVLGFVMVDSNANIGAYGKKYRNYYRYYGKKKYGYYKKHYGYYSKSYGYGYRQHKEEENKENIEE